MLSVTKKYKAAAVTAESGWFNLEESIKKTIHWINEAGNAGCKLIAFPEVCKSSGFPHSCPSYQYQPPLEDRFRLVETIIPKLTSYT